MFPKEQNKHVIYYWWNDNPNIKPYQDLRSPVILSIATLRAFHKEVPITILDISDFERPVEDWAEFQQVLNFRVVKCKTDMDTSRPRYWKLCSKISEIYKNLRIINEENVIFVDSDIFFLKPLFPLEYENEMKEKFCCWPFNTGFFYFNKNTQSNQELLKTWEDVIARCLHDDEFYESIKKSFLFKENCLEDEICFLYLTNKENKFDVQCLDFKKENYCLNHAHLVKDRIIIYQIKMLHCLFKYSGKNRGCFCIIIDELKQNICKSLNYNLIKKIFKDELIRPSYNLQSISQMSQNQFECLLR